MFSTRAAARLLSLEWELGGEGCVRESVKNNPRVILSRACDNNVGNNYSSGREVKG